MTNLLFVCHGNICRSPMAEFIMKHLVHQSNLDHAFTIDSAATSTEEIGSPIYPLAAKTLAIHHIPYGIHSARQLCPSDYQTYDLLLGMDNANIENMTNICGGDPDGKIHRLMDFTNQPGEVADPWYTRDFEQTWQDLWNGCTSLLASLQRTYTKE